MGDATMDKPQCRAFWARVRKLRNDWLGGRNQENSVWANVDAWAVLMGKPPDNLATMLAASVHMYLFDKVLPNMLMVMTEKGLHILSAKNKIAYVSSVEKHKPADLELELKFEELSKDTVDAQIKAASEAVKASFNGKRLATLLKEGQDAKLAGRWNDALESAGVEKTSLKVGLRASLMVKMSDELKIAETSANIAGRAMKKSFIKQMESVLSDDPEVSNAKVSAAVSAALSNPTKKLKLKDIDPEELEVPVAPSVQSGGTYDLQPGAQSLDKAMTPDIIICQIVVKYAEYHAQIARTYLINPTSDQKKVYQALEAGRTALLNALVPGAKLGDVHAAAVKAITDLRPELKDKLVPSLGHGTGLELQTPSFSIKADNQQIAQPGMTFTITLGLENVEVKSEDKPATLPNGKYSMLVADLVAVEKTATKVLTNAVSVSLDDVRYTLDSSDDEDSSEEEENDQDRVQDIVNNTSGRRVTRSATKTDEQREREQRQASMNAKIDKAQKELLLKKAQEALGDGLDADSQDDDSGQDGKQERIVEAFKTPEEYPRGLERNQIYCDRENEAVFVPVGGFHIPFHISAIKSVTKLDEELDTILRLNFFFPTSGHTFAKDVSANMRTVMTKFPNLHYVKEMSFRSKDPHNLTRQFRQIKELQKQLRQKARMKEMERDIVEQEALVINKRPEGKNILLDDVSMRPPVRKGKCIGRLQAHVNGLRFRAGRTGEVFDLIYSNIKHFILQECKEREHEVLVHFHLRTPVLINKTKTYDVQFYTEVVEASVALDNRRRHMYDPDEIEEERREQLMKRKFNSAFRKFCRKVVDFTDELDDYDKPSPELAFEGVPFREMVTITPTLNTLCNLSGNPVFCITLDEIEHIHFERVEPSMKNFDMTIVLKSQMKPNSGVPQRISSIPMESLDTIRTWIYEKGNITFTVGTKALKWKVVMEGVYDELERGIFWKKEDEYGEEKDLGWNVLNVYNEDDEEEEGGEGGESESDFGASDAAESSDDDDDPDDYIDDDDEEDESSAEELSDEGEDWDQLEKQAAEDDKKRNRREREKDEEERINSKRRRKK
ncbi:FACT complex subunit SPT16 [Hondaea fermentalgiana]|uniref:FACT complex subunit n=1 Tax=Hondaea fermentalgiana TaxID=2315210 RepID=A0A2R5GAA2_9STRA|nr:FACT complex subunit SPT16 [Hondaea fermentalgiana]|eukprot:GBG27947.1 FACT complex subunit SPT16 [Hondaea fermentalgiana]